METCREARALLAAAHLDPEYERKDGTLIFIRYHSRRGCTSHWLARHEGRKRSERGSVLQRYRIVGYVHFRNLLLLDSVLLWSTVSSIRGSRMGRGEILCAVRSQYGDLHAWRLDASPR